MINLKSRVSFCNLETLQGVVGDDAYSGELSSSEAGVYLFPEARFSNQGKVQGWEVMARKSGVLRLLVSELSPGLKIMKRTLLQPKKEKKF